MLVVGVGVECWSGMEMDAEGNWSPEREVKLWCHGWRLFVMKYMILKMTQPFSDKEDQDEDSATAWFSQFFLRGVLCE